MPVQSKKLSKKINSNVRRLKNAKKGLRREEKLAKNIRQQQKKDELEQYKAIFESLPLNDEFGWNDKNWEKIGIPTFNEWEEILSLLPKYVNNSNVIFLTSNPKTKNVYYAITSNNKNRYTDTVNKIGKQTSRSEPAQGSDAYIKEITTDREFIYLSNVKRESLKYKSKKLFKGKFFKYFHNLEKLDLSSLQIYRKDQLEEVDYEPCLLYCLRNSKIVYTQEQIDNAKEDLPDNLNEGIIKKLQNYIKNEIVPLSVVNQIAKKIDMYIIIRVGEELYRYNKESKNGCITINLSDEHYYLDKQIEITKYAIDNYEKVKEIDNFNSIISINNKGVCKRDKKDGEYRFLSSWRVVNQLLANKDRYLTEILDELEIKNKQNEEPEEELNYVEEECKLHEYKERKDISEQDLVFFDFETTTDTEIHKSFMVCAKKYRMVENNYEEVEAVSFKGSDCGLDLLKWIDRDTIMFAHNLKYDFDFLMKYVFSINLTERNNKIMGGTVMFHNIFTKKNFHISLRDTYLMIPKKLGDFPEMFFKAEQRMVLKKEVMPYSAYTEESVKKELIPIRDAMKFLNKRQRLEFIDNLYSGSFIKDNQFDHIKYADFYCKQDVNVMVEGYFIFREWIKEITGLDIIRYLTVSSIADEFLVKKECYEDCYKFSGNIRRFIQKCVVGGRCMIKDNKKNSVEALVQDFDAVSLYPSAMRRMGFLKGKPKIIEDLDYDKIKNFDGYFLKIDIMEIGRELHFPILNRKNDNGIREFRNDLLGEHYVDKVTLEDLIKYQQIKFNVLKGYYFNEGRNTKIQETIEMLFEERKRKKAEGNLIQEVYKLIMNSCYGKTILKFQDKRVTYKNNKVEAMKYIMRNIDYVCEFNMIHDSTKYRIKVLEQTDDLFTSPHIGAEILSMSKRIMNEVMCLADEIECEIYYQDTDSMHILDSDLKRLEDAFRDRFGRELIGSGKEMGQFHGDFSVGQDKGTDPISIQSVYCAKKVYVDKIKCIIKGKEEMRYHVRCKGITENALKEVCNNQYQGDYIRLFTDLKNGKRIEFNLLAGGGIKFHFDNNFTVCSRKEFKREVWCEEDEEVRKKYIKEKRITI